jgi:hypothetical protein
MRDKIAIIVWMALAAPALADGGTVHLSAVRDGKTVTVFTAPSLPRAGMVDVSIFVQDADSGQPISDMPIMVRARSIRSGEGISSPATTEAATNKLMRSALLELPEPGTWHVVVEGFASPIEFDLEIAEPLPPWLDLWPWICWPVVPIALFGILQVVMKKHKRDTCAT